jgi:hypothetical protein
MFVGYEPARIYAVTRRTMDQKSSQPSRKRRAILRGSLAAPVVLTVSSPTAAQVTSFGKCLANIGTQQPTKFFEQTADTWLRASIDVVQYKHGSDTAWFFNDPSYNDWVRITDLARLKDLNGWTPDQGVAAQKRLALVWVDGQTGSQWKVIQVQQPLSGYQFTTLSCNASVNPTIK